MSLLARLIQGTPASPASTAPSLVETATPFEHRIRVVEEDAVRAVSVWSSGPPLRLPDADEAAHAAAQIAGDGRVLPVVVLDCETTGLGWGQNVPFVIGVAWANGSTWCVEQWVLGTYAGEVAMLRDLVRALESRGPLRLLTFNGSSFDVPVLRSRGVRCGVDPVAAFGCHLDALHVSRRLWRARLPDCRLTTLERWLLGQSRIDDIPSHEIPQVFQDVIDGMDGAGDRLDAVCEHNAADLLALGGLLPTLRDTLARPHALVEALGAARHFLATDREAHARDCLAGALEVEAPWREAPHESLREAGLTLARLHRRQGDDGACTALWKRLAARFPGDPQVHEGWAKHLEHRVGAPDWALRVALASRAPCPRRVARLQRKAAV